MKEHVNLSQQHGDMRGHSSYTHSNIGMPDNEIVIEDLKTINLEPGDTLMVRLRERVPTSTIPRLIECFRGFFPDSEVIVLNVSADLSIIRRNRGSQ